MKPDVVIVGSGPAGVSVAFPLVQAGLRVLMVDGGTEPTLLPPQASRLADFVSGPDYRRHLLGERFEALAGEGQASPKLRLPVNRFAMAGFGAMYGLRTDNFRAVGSLAAGGLSKIWGAGVCSYSREELQAFPCPAAELERSYRAVGQRIGVSGVDGGDLAEYFGSGVELQPPCALGTNAARLLSRYTRQRPAARQAGVAIGYARNAILTEPHRGRAACIRCGLCLWGCHQGSIYSASYDLEALKRYENFHYRSGVFVADIQRGGDSGPPRLHCRSLAGGHHETIAGERVVLACGTLGSTALVLRALRPEAPTLRLLSSPAAGFALLLPERLGQSLEDLVFGLSQLTLVQQDRVFGDRAYGNLFEAGPVPIAELARHLTLLRPVARRALQVMRPAMLVGNAFLSGDYTRHSFSLTTDGSPLVRGGYTSALDARLKRLRSAVTQAMLRCGVVVLPGSFKVVDPGADVHYAATLPMSRQPRAWETGSECEVAGLPGVYVVDGACLPSLPAKAHTFTIMANADRAGRSLAARLRA